ncbi:MAG: ABC transporter permease [Firmicutes bacterium]|nr:ABC transporter permease [Bacillota bacterium]
MLGLLVSLVRSSLDASAPLLLAAMGGIFAQQAGVLNIGLEGMMLFGAFAGVIVSFLTHSVLLAVLAAAVAGLLMAALFSAFAIALRANVVVVGLAINIAAVGLAGYLLPVAFGVQGAFAPPGLTGLATIDVPLLAGIPVVGGILQGHTALVYLAWLSVWVTALVLYRTVFGLRLRATGEDKEAALAAGVPVVRLQWAGVLCSGLLAGIAGVQLSLGELTLFNKNMTGGRGFIALAAFYFGANRPWPTAMAALLFGLFQALQYRLQGSGVPPQIMEMIPYLGVVISLVAVQLRKVRGQRPMRRSQNAATGPA